METTSNKIWAKLVALRPEKENISLFTKLDEPNQYQVDGEWKIDQNAAGETKIVCLSASCIKVNDVWLGMNQEKTLKGGEMIAFSEEKNITDNSFDYVYCLINRTPVGKLERKRDENDESKYNLIYQKMKKFTNEMNQEFNCAICIEIISDCTTLIPCLHHFCGHCINKLFKSSKECPLCRKKIESLNKNSLMQRLIDSTISVLDFEESKQKAELSQENSFSEENGNYIGNYSSDGKREGQGKMTYDDGSIYDGTWKNGKKEGKGVLTLKNGDIYKGRWIDGILQPFIQIEYFYRKYYFGEVKDLQRHGNGIFINPSATYDGSWFEDKRQGWGKYTTNSRTYEGNWKNDQMYGYGSMKWKDGPTLEGEWCKGRILGEGTLIQTNGDVLKGKWTSSAQGEGEVSFVNGNNFHGFWKGLSYNNLSLTFKNGDEYSDVWKSSSSFRDAYILYSNGDRYKGKIEMENLEKQGKGRMVFRNGNEYDGDWDSDKLHGNGKYTWKKDACVDSVYEGQFQNGKKNGIGTLTNADGSKWTGEWKDDEKVIKQEITPENSTNEIGNST